MQAADPHAALREKFPSGADLTGELLALLATPTIADKTWVSRQYDHQLFLNTVNGPGSDAAVLRVRGTRKALALGADLFARKPVDREVLIALLNQATASRVLIIDDDATTRYAMRKILEHAKFVVLEAATGEDGLRVAEVAQPRSIVLDLGLPDVNGFSMLDRLKASPTTRDIPVIVATAHELSDVDRATLESQALVVMSKREMLGTIAANVAIASSAHSPSAVDPR